MHENRANAMQTHDFGSLWTRRRGSQRKDAKWTLKPPCARRAQVTASALAGVQAKDRSGNLRGATDS